MTPQGPCGATGPRRVPPGGGPAPSERGHRAVRSRAPPPGSAPGAGTVRALKECPGYGVDGTSRTILGAFLTAFFMPYLW